MNASYTIDREAIRKVVKRVLERSDSGAPLSPHCANDEDYVPPLIPRPPYRGAAKPRKAPASRGAKS